MTPKISIVVPVYNAEEYLDKCLNSIQAQTYHNFEVIMVDDGSMDQSREILSKWSNKDRRFFTFHKENGGASSARNEGLRQVIGDYICFVDADDSIAPTYLEDLYNAMGNQVDSSMGGFKKIDSLSHLEFEIVPQKGIETLEENLLGFYASCSTDWQRYIVNRMFKMSIIRKNNLSFQENLYYKEDGLFLVQYLCASNGLVGCIDKVLYYYNLSSSGAIGSTQKGFNPKLITNLESHRLIIKELEKKGLTNIIRRAKVQAKTSCNWIQILLSKLPGFHPVEFFSLETKMIRILGFHDYLKWRYKNFFRNLTNYILRRSLFNNK